jgi:hypothetical protein
MRWKILLRSKPVSELDYATKPITFAKIRINLSHHGVKPTIFGVQVMLLRRTEKEHDRPPDEKPWTDGAALHATR